MKDELSGRLAREFTTVDRMIRLYCRGKHDSGPKLCDSCSRLHHYAARRLRHCPFQQRKPTCGSCPVHCYSPQYRRQIREVMRYAGPRMLLKHPLLALLHAWDNRRRRPPKCPGQTSFKQDRRRE